MKFRQWEVWKCRPEGFARDHWFVIASGQERCDDPRPLLVNGLAEIKQTIGAMSEDERFLAAAFLRILARENDPDYRRSMTERCDHIAEGRKSTLDQAIRMHAALESEGL